MRGRSTRAIFRDGVRQSAWHLAVKPTGTEINNTGRNEEKETSKRCIIEFTRISPRPRIFPSFFLPSSSLYSFSISHSRSVQGRADPCSQWQIIGWLFVNSTPVTRFRPVGMHRHRFGTDPPWLCSRCAFRFLPRSNRSFTGFLVNNSIFLFEPFFIYTIISIVDFF